MDAQYKSFPSGRFARVAPANILTCAGLVVSALLLPPTAWCAKQADEASRLFKHSYIAGIVTRDVEQSTLSKDNHMTTKEVIEGYFAGLKQKKGWESFLAEDMIFNSYTSPVKQVTGKAAYIESTKRFYGGITTFEVRDLLIDGDKACALTRYQLQRPGSSVFESDVAEVFRVRDGKIVSFDIYFDSAPFPK